MNKTGAYKIAEQLVKTMAGELCMSGDFNIEHMSIDIQQEIYNTLKVHIRQKDIVTLVLQGMANKMRNWSPSSIQTKDMEEGKYSVKGTRAHNKVPG